jgi:hypothetical protein
MEVIRSDRGLAKTDHSVLNINILVSPLESEIRLNYI